MCSLSCGKSGIIVDIGHGSARIATMFKYGTHYGRKFIIIKFLLNVLRVVYGTHHGRNFIIINFLPLNMQLLAQGCEFDWHGYHISSRLIRFWMYINRFHDNVYVGETFTNIRESGESGYFVLVAQLCPTCRLRLVRVAVLFEICV
jgi:hypothetical protein